jgi:phage protein D/FlaG/FlaF family flagellin (archaellin)
MASTLYISQPKVSIGGDSSDNLMRDILKIMVEESLHLPAMFTVVLHNNYIPASSGENTQPWRHQKHLEIGKEVKISFSASHTKDGNFNESEGQNLIEGEITAIEVDFTSKSESHIYIRGYDKSHRLHRGCYNRSFLKMTDSEVVQKIAQEVGLKPDCKDTGEARDYIFQENQTNMEFLRELSARNGFELFIQDGTLYFREPKSQGSLDLEWLKDINAFNVRVSSAQQVKSVEVRGWDYKEKKAIVETANTEEVVTEVSQNGKGSESATKFQNLPAPKMIVTNQPVFSPEEAKTIAQSCCNELGAEFIYADAKADTNGNPKIRPGRVVNLKDMGKYDGKYYITETRHIYQNKVYSTHFSVRGLRDGSLLSTLTPKTPLRPGQNLLVGIVTNNNDPEGWGRVKVKLPSLTEDHESNWARVVSIGAGPERGWDCLPEIDDEVLVGFEHGNVHRPYVIGSVWNGKDKVPESVEDSVQEGKVRLRTFRTRIKHQLQFVEEDKGDSKSGVYLHTAKQHHMHLNDSDQFVEIKTESGHTIRLDDCKKFVEIETKGKHKIRLDDQNRSVTVESKGGHKLKMDDMGKSVSLTSAGTMDISATGSLTIKGATVSVTGTPIKLN